MYPYPESEHDESRRRLLRTGGAALAVCQVSLAMPKRGNGPDGAHNVFAPEEIDPATQRVNELLASTGPELLPRTVEALRSAWSGRPQWSSEMIAAGAPGAKLPPAPPSSAVGERVIDVGGGRDVRFMCLTPPTKPRGVYFYVHGGGWVAQSPDDYIQLLWEIARNADVAVVAPIYRLAPEHPFPAAPDDVLAAASWLSTAGRRDYQGPLVIGGDSAGGHLAALTLQRLRDEAHLTPFRAADLVYGAYDLSLSPSARLHGSRPPLTTDAIRRCVDWACPIGDRTDPKISPLYGRTNDLPPALFSVGSGDTLLDDTLFMRAR